MGNFPEDVTVKWGLSFDNEMPTDEIRLDAIAAGKNLNYIIPTDFAGGGMKYKY